MRPPVPISLLDLVSAARLNAADIYGNPDVMVTGISTHAQTIERNQLFVATVGTKVDSHMLISEAVDRGASVVVVERDIPSYPGVTMVRVPDTRWALGQLAHGFHGNPARAMTVVGVTGTNGKTTSTSLINAVMAHTGRRTGLIGTLGTFWNNQYVDNQTTTPDALRLAKLFAQMEMDRVDFAVMEVSSHAIHQARIAGIPFHAGAITNVTQDHLDYHKDIPTYIGVKRSFFFDHVAPTSGSVSAFNMDDPVGEELCDSYGEEQVSYSATGKYGATVRAENVQLRADGTTFDLLIAGGEAVTINARLIGSFNLSNMLCAAAVCHGLGVDAREIAAALEVVPPISGRFERIDEGQPFTVIVDYAHTPDAIEKVLRTARRIATGKILTVFGCGGDRDRSKRSPMGSVAGSLSDYAILTSDNPRTEDPDLIARQALEGLMQSGMKRRQYDVVLDRARAIEKAVMLARQGDCVVITGKGHETYQEIMGVKHPFDDRVVAREALRAVAGKRSTEVSVEAVDRQMA